jgi:rSAM/selenodomain-associated transferase 2
MKVAAAAGARVMTSNRGRGTQLACGAVAAHGDVLLFLHADTLLPVGFREEVLRIVGGGAVWGRFDVRFDEGTPLVHAIAHLISWRSRLTRGATGDQAMFVRRDVFDRIGGFREAVLFEDVDLSRRLKRSGRMGIPGHPVVTSARRWRRHGAVRTSLRMWTLKLLYLAGVPASTLARYYPNTR